MAKEKALWYTAMGEELVPLVDGDPDFEARLSGHLLDHLQDRL
jgi:hypothetical protein